MEFYNHIKSYEILKLKSKMLKLSLKNEFDSEDKWRNKDTEKDQEQFFKSHYFECGFQDFKSNPIDYKDKGLFREELFKSSEIEKRFETINNSKSKYINILRNFNSNNSILTFYDSYDKEFLIAVFNCLNIDDKYEDHDLDSKKIDLSSNKIQENDKIIYNDNDDNDIFYNSNTIYNCNDNYYKSKNIDNSKQHNNNNAFNFNILNLYTYELCTDTSVRFIKKYKHINNIENSLCLCDNYSVYFLKPSFSIFNNEDVTTDNSIHHSAENNIIFNKIAWLDTTPIKFISDQYYSSFFTLNNNLTLFSNLNVSSCYELKNNYISGCYFNDTNVILLNTIDSIFMYDLRIKPYEKLINKYSNDTGYIKNLKTIDQFHFSITSNRSIKIYDIRYPLFCVYEEYLGINYEGLEIKDITTDNAYSENYKLYNLFKNNNNLKSNINFNNKNLDLDKFYNYNNYSSIKNKQIAYDYSKKDFSCLIINQCEYDYNIRKKTVLSSLNNKSNNYIYNSSKLFSLINNYDNKEYKFDDKSNNNFCVGNDAKEDINNIISNNKFIYDISLLELNSEVVDAESIIIYFKKSCDNELLNPININNKNNVYNLGYDANKINNLNVFNISDNILNSNKLIQTYLNNENINKYMLVFSVNEFSGINLDIYFIDNYDIWGKNKNNHVISYGNINICNQKKINEYRKLRYSLRRSSLNQNRNSTVSKNENLKKIIFNEDYKKDSVNMLRNIENIGNKSFLNQNKLEDNYLKTKLNLYVDAFQSNYINNFFDNNNKINKNYESYRCISEEKITRLLYKNLTLNYINEKFDSNMSNEYNSDKVNLDSELNTIFEINKVETYDTIIKDIVSNKNKSKSKKRKNKKDLYDNINNKTDEVDINNNYVKIGGKFKNLYNTVNNRLLLDNILNYNTKEILSKYKNNEKELINSIDLFNIQSAVKTSNIDVLQPLIEEFDEKLSSK